MTNSPKYPRYQDYVIKDGRLVGEFEQLYRDYDDPWEQSTRETWASDKVVTLSLIERLGVERVMELGCGLGHFTNRIAQTGVEVLGVDVSPIAIGKARAAYPGCRFVAADVLDRELYRDFQPSLIVMAEITWYILDKLDELIELLRSEASEAYLIHLLTMYPEGAQEYGRDRFTDLAGIMASFPAHFLEWGEIRAAGPEGTSRTYFLAEWRSQEGSVGPC